MATQTTPPAGGGSSSSGGGGGSSSSGGGGGGSSSSNNDDGAPADSAPRHSLVLALVEGELLAWQVTDAVAAKPPRFTALPVTLSGEHAATDDLRAVRHMASFRDTCAMVTAERQLRCYRASVASHPSGALSLLLAKSRQDVTLPEDCTSLSVSELAIWAASKTQLHVVKQQAAGPQPQPQPQSPPPLVSFAVAPQQIRKLVALCCTCVIGTETGDVLLAAMRCCGAAGQLLSVAKIDLASSAAALDAFQSSIVLTDSTGHGLVFSCMREARSSLLKMATVQQQQPPLLSVDPKLATLVADTVRDIAILSPRSVALLCSDNTVQFIRW